MGRGEREPSGDLARLSEAVARWRSENGGGGRGKRIPEKLWNEAVRVARIDGVWRTAKAARFNYQAIKQRLELADDDAKERARASARRSRSFAWRDKPMGGPRRASRRQNEFVELSAAELLGAPSTSTVVEIEDRLGGRMVVRLAGETKLDEVARLISVFRRQRR